VSAKAVAAKLVRLARPPAAHGSAIAHHPPLHLVVHPLCSHPPSAVPIAPCNAEKHRS